MISTIIPGFLGSTRSGSNHNGIGGSYASDRKSHRIEGSKPYGFPISGTDDEDDFSGQLKSHNISTTIGGAATRNNAIGLGWADDGDSAEEILKTGVPYKSHGQGSAERQEWYVMRSVDVKVQESRAGL